MRGVTAIRAHPRMGEYMTAVLDVVLPVRLPQAAHVKALLHETPSPDLHMKLIELGYHVHTYADERIGPVTRLDDVRHIARVAANRVWKVETFGGFKDGAIVGSLLAHARVYIPDATSATLVAPVEINTREPLVHFRGEWVVWGKASVRVG